MATLYPILLEAHAGWRYLVLLLLLVALVKYLVGWLGGGVWGRLDTLLARVNPIMLDIQWLLGLFLVIAKLVASDLLGILVGAHWEHLTLLTIAVVIAHLISARLRKATTDAGKFRTAAIGYLLVTLLVVGGVARLIGWNIFA